MSSDSVSAVLKAMESQDIDLVLGERLDLSSVREGRKNEKGQRVLRTESGREIEADLLVRRVSVTAHRQVILTLPAA